MGHYGLERSTACTTVATTLIVADYEVSDDLDHNYALAWEALQDAIAILADAGYRSAECLYQDGTIRVYV